MHRIDTKTAQKDKFGAGKNGFTRGNPQTGTPATDLDDDYFDMLQEELCSVVEASGASLEKGRHDQLLTALRALLLSRNNPFGDIKSDGTVPTALENLGLGNSATRNVGTTTGTVAAGDDSRITGAVQGTSAALCTAWVNFSGVSPATIRGSLNVSSVTRLQTGQYQINYATPLANSNYAPVLTLGDAPNAGTLAAVVAVSGSATGSPVKKDVDGIIVQARASNTVADVSEFNVVIFGGR